MLSKILLIPLGIGAIVFLYLAWQVDSGYAIWIVPFVVLIAGVYVMGPQLDWWSANKKPPELDERLRKMLHDHLPFYQHLSLEGKKRFRERMALFMLAHDYSHMVAEEVPEDLKAIIAANAVQLTFGQEDFLLEKFEKVIIYPHPFPSPQFPEHFHVSETFEEDGVVLFTDQNLMRGFLQPQQFFNIGLHEFAQVFIVSYPERPYPQLDDTIWEYLPAISGYSKDKLQHWMGLPYLDPLPVSMVYFFTHSERFKQVLPDLFEQYAEVFNLNPLEKYQPIRYLNLA